ncbi:MAG: FapA family protein [Treponema sp.]|jgi:uncharacterized protein (DUF342 family)|nr:FapA family protein [Treponema sp.]
MTGNKTFPEGTKTSQDVMGPQTIITGNRNDGNLMVIFSENDMEAYADFIPPVAEGAPINQTLVRAILAKLNIAYGIRWRNIRNGVNECNQTRKLVKNVLIAKGLRPVSEVGEYFEVNPHLGERSKPPEGSKRVDYRAYTPFIIVKKNQTLALLKKRKEGRDGKNIHGVSVPFPVLHPDGVRGGANTRTEGEYIYAEIDGQLVEKNKVLEITDSLTIKGPVGYATGNIIFPGNVTISGPVSDGFKIYCGGSISIKQTFDVTDAIARGDLTVSGGIIGRGLGQLKIGGSIKTKFIENCRAAARKTITVTSEINNSTVYTLESVEMGDRGLILGGEIYAVNKVRTGGIGRKIGKSSKLHLGIDFTAEQEKEKNNDNLKILDAKIRKLREILETEEAGSGRRPRLEDMLKQLLEEQQKAADKITELLGRVIANENASVEVLGAIIPGTLIEICQVALFIAEPLHHVRLRLDKDTGKIVVESL